MSHALAGKIAIEAIFYSALGFVAAVSFFWPWWKSQLGWSIVAKSLALATAVFQAMLVFWFGPSVYTRAPWVFWFSIAGLFVVPPILVWRAVVIWHAQRKARDVI